MACTASRTSSPWHNFVSNTEHWTEINGETLCSHNGGIYNKDEVASIVAKGAQKIWIEAKSATLEGSPSGAGKKLQDHSKIPM